MKVKIKQVPGVFTDAEGKIVSPTKGEEVEVSDELGRAFVEAGQAEEVGASAAGGNGPNASANAVSKATELGVDLAGVQGTGANGQITVSDVEKAAQKPDEERGDDGASETTASAGPTETR